MMTVQELEEALRRELYPIECFTFFLKQVPLAGVRKVYDITVTFIATLWLKWRDFPARFLPPSDFRKCFDERLISWRSPSVCGGLPLPPRTAVSIVC